MQLFPSTFGHTYYLTRLFFRHFPIPLLLLFIAFFSKKKDKIIWKMQNYFDCVCTWELWRKANSFRHKIRLLTLKGLNTPLGPEKYNITEVKCCDAYQSGGNIGSDYHNKTWKLVIRFVEICSWWNNKKNAISLKSHQEDNNS
jgi:hypothetical protein